MPRASNNAFGSTNNNNNGYAPPSSQNSRFSPNGKRGGASFADPNNVGMMSIPRQTKFYIERLRSEAIERCNKVFEFNEMIRIGKEINL